jgi:hypothetical protein
MRKIVVGLSAVALAVCMAGCGEDKPVVPQTPPVTVPETPKAPVTSDVKEEVEKKADEATKSNP